MAIISFTKVKYHYGWMGNMFASEILYDNKIWRTSEALFQALRFNDPSIIEEIRTQNSPMAAKMVSKRERRNYTIVPCSDEDINNMRLCLRLKFEQNSILRQQLIASKDDTIIEDVSARRGARHEFWGARRIGNDEWQGKNMMGILLMELRTELQNAANTTI